MFATKLENFILLKPSGDTKIHKRNIIEGTYNLALLIFPKTFDFSPQCIPISGFLTWAHDECRQLYNTKLHNKLNLSRTMVKLAQSYGNVTAYENPFLPIMF